MATPWLDDDTLFDTMRRELSVAVVGDIMDGLGLLHQFLPPQVKPLSDDMVLAGRAMPVIEADIVERSMDGEATENRRFGLMFDALDSLKRNEVYLAHGGSPGYAFWGELMSVRAHALGAAGAVMTGYSRDTSGILAQGFPTFSLGGYAQDQAPRGRVEAYRVPVQIAHVAIAPADVVFGDRDGVCVIPRVMADEVIRLALDKVRGERLVRDALENGMTAAEAFRRFGIL